MLHISVPLCYICHVIVFLCCVIISRRIITPLSPLPRKFTLQVHIISFLLRHHFTQTHMPICHKPVFCVHFSCYMLLFSYIFYNVCSLGTCSFHLQVILYLLDRPALPIRPLLLDLIWFKHDYHVIINSSDGRVSRASCVGAAHSGLIPSRVNPMTLKLVVAVSLLDAQL